jgi:hypothetical protein
MSNATCTKCRASLQPDDKFCKNCGAMVEQTAAEGEDPLVGRIVADRYRIAKVLGEGGMGRVYLAEQKMGAATRKVAIKTLHPELGGDAQLVARFYRECETVIELSHPNTIQFYDFGKFDDGTLYIVMEFIEGAALAQVLERQNGRGLELPRCDKILIQICGSLHEAHGRGIVHRDLKPDNVLLTNRGGQTDFVKVLDFGIAKRSEAEDEKKGKLTQQGMVLGTPPYMSPEQFGGQALDARSDIYSLGVMVYEMLTGKLPFEARTPWEWATKHLTAAPESLDTHPGAAHVPPAKRAAVMKALQKNRESRQSTVLEFLQEFTGHQDAQAAWTMATSAGGAILPKSGDVTAPGARTPVPTPGPMPQAQPTPGYGTGGMGASTPPPGFGAPSFPPGGYPGGPGMGYGAPTAAPRGSGVGKYIAIGVVALFVLGGIGLGGLFVLSQLGDDANVEVVVPGPGQPGTPTPAPPGPLNPVVGTAGLGPAVPPTQPSTVLQPPGDVVLQPIAPTQPAPTQPEPTPTPPVAATPEPQPVNPPRNDGPSGAQIAEAQRIAQGGESALDQNDVPGAVAALTRAQRLVGRSHGSIASLRRRVTLKGSNRVGSLIQSGNCEAAQALFRQLRSAGAEADAREHFGDWCTRP